MTIQFICRTVCVLSIVAAGCGQQSSSSQQGVSENMHIVTPITKNKSMIKSAGQLPQQHAVEELRIGNGQFFSYALPPGWRVGEDGQFALSLVAPDKLAFTVMVGNAGLMPGYQPNQFVYTKMMAMQPQNLQLSNPMPAQPVAGFQQAYAYSINYSARGMQYRGVAICHIAPYYGGCTMAMTAAISEISQWPSYAAWLPKVAQQIATTNGGAFGMRGVMQQNLHNSMAYAEAAKEYRNWSQQKWQEVTDYRNAVQDKQQEQFRDNLGAVTTYNNPFGGSTAVELNTQYKYYWMDRQGQIVGTDDVSVNPNQGSTGDWRQMDAKNK